VLITAILNSQFLPIETRQKPKVVGRENQGEEEEKICLPATLGVEFTGEPQYIRFLSFFEIFL